MLPDEFIKTTRELMGEERFSSYLAAFDQATPVSIRLNPLHHASLVTHSLEQVPWCRHAYYLSERPNFTFDPLLHAGCYYVQEAASMFLDTVLQQHLPTVPLTALDLCAAPGGKSTLLRSALPEGSVLYSNEPVAKRASILLENITKWGWPDCIVTNSYPRDYVRSGLKFDVILCDVPCSGEGMFRKDPQTISEWSPQNVEKCWRLQRDIVSDAWQCLNGGGLLIYCTCTFNINENEENIRWILETFDAEALPVDTEAGWGITGSLLEGFAAPVYRFIPGITRSEGLFMAALRKGGGKGRKVKEKGKREGLRVLTSPLAPHSAHPAPRYPQTTHPTPRVDFANPQTTHPTPRVDLDYPQAIAYLQRQALQLPPDTPLGLVEVCYQGFPLGLVKNIGTRANNLYPKEWAIKSTHVPSSPVAVL